MGLIKNFLKKLLFRSTLFARRFSLVYNLQWITPELILKPSTSKQVWISFLNLDFFT